MELTVQDYGTSHHDVKGEWFEISMNDDLIVLKITAGELKEMLANRVDGLSRKYGRKLKQAHSQLSVLIAC